jgi:hypothetical protein
MSEEINLTKVVYDKNQYEKLVNTNFSQLDSEVDPQILLNSQPTVPEFFKMYNELFYQIPKEGQNSHQILIQQSSEYVDFETDTQEIEVLQNEIAQLRQQLLDEQKKVIELQTGETVDISPSNPVLNNSNTSNSY